MTRVGFLAFACLFVLCGTLFAGLAPFRGPINAVSWSQDHKGLVFGDYGTIESPDSFVSTDPANRASSSLEIWMQPGLTIDSNTFLTFSTPKNPLQFSLHQYQSSMVLDRCPEGDKGKILRIGVDGIFREIRPIFIAITSNPHQTAIYVDGKLAEIFPGFSLQNDFSGQLVYGTSPAVRDTWQGNLLGLAVYRQELSPEQVATHYRTWTTQGRPLYSAEEHPIALYLFDEKQGNVAHNSVDSRFDLKIPARYHLLHQVFLKPFWKEYKPSLDYWTDILLNIAGLLPLGFIFAAFLDALGRTQYTLLYAIGLGFAVSLTIEVLQSYLPTRNSGTTDLFTNTFGAFLGAKIQTSAFLRSALVPRLPLFLRKVWSS